MTEYEINECYTPVEQPTDSFTLDDVVFDRCIHDDFFYISTTKPFIFANRNKKLIKQTVSTVGKGGNYKRLVVSYKYLDENNRWKTHQAKVHRLIAQQYLFNDDPLRKTEVDHRNRNPCDNDISNLRWVSPRLNKYNRIIDERHYFVDHLSEQVIRIPTYGDHQLEDDEVSYWFDPADDMLYVKVDDNSYRSFVLSSGHYTTSDVDGQIVCINLNKLKSMGK